MSAKFVYVSVPTKIDAFWKSGQHLENIKVDAFAMAPTQIKRIYQIACFQSLQPTPLTANKLADAYAVNLKLSPHSEAVSTGFVDNAMTIMNRMLNLPDVAEALRDADGDPASPLRKADALQRIIQKVRLPGHIRFVTLGILDAYHNGDFKDTGNPSMVDLRQGDFLQSWLLRSEFKNYLMGEFVRRLEWDDQLVMKQNKSFHVSDLLVDVYESHKSYSENCGWSANAKKGIALALVDETWRSCIPRSAKAFCQLIELSVYGNVCSGTFGEAAAKGRRMMDLVEMSPIKALVDQCLAFRDEERGVGQTPANAVVDVSGPCKTRSDDDDDDESPTSESPPEPFKDLVMDKVSKTTADFLASKDAIDWIALQHAVAKKLNSSVKLLDGSATETELKNNLASTAAATFVPLRSNDVLRSKLVVAPPTTEPTPEVALAFRGRVAILYDVSTAGESTSRPDHRVCSLRH